MPTLPQVPIYRENSPAQLKVHKAGKFAAALAAICVFYSLVAAVWAPARCQIISGGMAAIWAVGAPVWFWYEYYFIYRGDDGGMPDSFEYFKQGQQTAIAIWAGLSAALGAFAISDYSKPPSNYECKVEVPASNNPPSTTTLTVPMSNVILKCVRSAA